jgi:hypothetical protein
MVKKTFNKEQIDSVKSSLYYKIFDILKKDEQIYYLDRDYNLIWDEQKEVVGLIDKKEYLFFSDIENIIKITDNEMNYLIKMQQYIN